MLLQRIVTLILILGTACAHLLRQDIFPFSNYPMYSRPFNPEFDFYRHELKGITPSGAEIDLKIWTYLPPFWKSSLRESLLVEYEKAKIEPKLRSVLSFYNRHAESRTEELIIGLRLYRFKPDWIKIVEDIKADNSFSGDMGSNVELFVEVRL